MQKSALTHGETAKPSNYLVSNNFHGIGTLAFASSTCWLIPNVTRRYIGLFL
jgi:hypothetical protein